METKDFLKSNNVYVKFINLVLCFLWIFFFVTLSDSSGQMKPSITIGMAGDAETFDQHLSTSTISWSYQFSVFDALVNLDDSQKPISGLAKSWRTIDDRTWEFKLREGVAFHNGEKFDATSVKFSLERAKTHPKSLQKGYIALVREITIIDPATIQIKTEKPFPDLPLNVSHIAIYPEKYIKSTGDEKFAYQPIGTGPYKVVEWIKDRHAKLMANDSYWGGPPRIKEATLRPIPEGVTRVAALLRGEVDIIEHVPFPDIKRVNSNPGTRVISRPGIRIIYVAFDVKRQKGGPAPDGSPGIPAGQPNPFTDIRVRQAVYYALDIDEITKFVMQGAATPADQFIPSVWFGAQPGMKRPKFDLERAKKLLAEAGYPNGFKVRMDCTSDRYINDKEIAIAIAAQLSKAGIMVEVNALPRAIFFPKMQALETSFHLSGWGGVSAGHSLLALVGTINPKTGGGRANYGAYSNPKMDNLIELALTTLLPAKRMEYFKAASELIQEDVAKVPLHFENINHGISNKFDMGVRIDDQVRPYEISPR